MTLLFTGGSGVLGRELVKLFPESLAPSHKQLELRNKKFMSITSAAA